MHAPLSLFATDARTHALIPFSQEKAPYLEFCPAALRNYAVNQHKPVTCTEKNMALRPYSLVHVSANDPHNPIAVHLAPPHDAQRCAKHVLPAQGSASTALDS